MLSHRSRGVVGGAVFLTLATVVIAVSAWLVHGFATDVRSQEKYNRGSGIEISLWESGEDYPRLVKHIVDNKMLDKRTELVEVQKAKALLPGIIDSFYFDSIWGIFNYLAIVHDSASIRTLMDFALKEGLLNISKECINFSQCERRENYNLTSGNASELAAFLRAFYMKTADEFVESGDLESAQSMFAQMLSVLRRVDTPLSDPSNHKLSSLYVRGIFSVLIDPAQAETSQTQLELLDRFLNGDSKTLTGNRYIDAYIGGMQYLRDGCYANGYRHFSEMLDHTSFDYLEELFSFLALRSYFTGLLDRNALRIDPLTKKIFFPECNKWVEISEWASAYQSLNIRTY